MARVQVVCFSMDRVFQLSEYLRTLHQHLLLHGRRLRDDPSWAQITVICRCTSQTVRVYYEEIAARYAHVQFLYENESRDFAACLLESLQLPPERGSPATTVEDDDGEEDEGAEEENAEDERPNCSNAAASTASSPHAQVKCPYVLLNVDDAFYFDDVDLAKAEQFFGNGAPPAMPSVASFGTEEAKEGKATTTTTPTTTASSGSSASSKLPLWRFSFHVKLAPSIWRSHLTNKPMLPLPPMTTAIPLGMNAATMASNRRHADKCFLTFDPARGCLDWSYPWELSGSVFRRETVERVIKEIQIQFGRHGISRPNHLELMGHQIVHGQWMNQTHRLRCGCLPRPKMHVFAINQVQDVFANRLYATDHATLASEENGELLTRSTGDLAHLLRLYESKETLDELYYRRHRFSSVHIGSLVLTAAASAQTRVRGSMDWSADHTPLVSVVMPVYNLERYVQQALESVLMQSYPQMEIIVIDDASTDATSKILQAMLVRDPRIKYVRNAENLGVAASLNKGFALAQGTFVARMDGDDIAFPDRIQRQIHYMLEHPNVDILGTSVLLGREKKKGRSVSSMNGDQPEQHGDMLDNDDSSSDDSQGNDSSVMLEGETVVYPTSPLITKWHLLFGCFVAHPTVMMNRRVLNTIATLKFELYSTNKPSCEDYDLWLRCTYRHNLTIMSLGDVLLYHRKHAKSTSAVHSQDQMEQTRKTAAACFERILDGITPPFDPSAMLPLLDHEREFTAQEYGSAIKLLTQLQERLYEMPSSGDTTAMRSGSSVVISVQEQELHRDELAAEMMYVQSDAAARQGELAFRAMLVDPVAGAALWSSFAREHPLVSRAAFEKLVAHKTS